MSDSKNDFDIAKSVSDLVKDLDRDRQVRIFRWVSESLGIADVGSSTSNALVKEVVPPPSAAASTNQQLDPRLANPPTLKQRDIKSFVEAKQPRSELQFAVVVAYYYRFEAPESQRLNSISPGVLQEATRLVGRNRLSSPRLSLFKAKKQGYLDTADRGEYVVNTVGENLVAMALPGDGAAAATPSKQKPARRSVSKKYGNKGTNQRRKT